MIVKFKKLHKNAVIPTQESEFSACWNLVAITKLIGIDYMEYGTGISIQVPEDHIGIMFPLNNISKTELLLSNAVSVIDPDYRGELIFRFKRLLHQKIGGVVSIYRSPVIYNIEDSIGQIVIIPRPFLEWKEVEELSKIDRSDSSYSSVGK